MPTLKQRAPARLKTLGRRVSVAVGERTAGSRMRPSFVLAGAQRCGTTSLFRALISHPAIMQPVHHKGINYFDVSYERGWSWYQGHFPLRARAALSASRANEEALTFDASGYYLYHPHAPARMAKDLVDVRVLVMLRDPVERAFSAYRHELARGFEHETFDRALQLEDERVGPELARMIDDPTYNSFSHRHHSYRRRGQYAEQLTRLVDAVGRERLLVVDSQDFFAQPEREYERITDFLGVSRHVPESFDRWNARPGAAMSSEARELLESAYRPDDAALRALLGREPSWLR